MGRTLLRPRGRGDQQGHRKRPQPQRGCLGPREDGVAQNSEPALEERRALASRPVEHAVPHKVKLPGFWEKDAATWFKLAEAVMKDNHVVDPQVMYRTVLLHIPHHVLERARGIQSLADTSVDPFMGLKNRLVELLTPKKMVVAAIKPATLEEETTLGEETALEKSVVALTIHNKKKWHSSKGRGGDHPRGSQGGSRGGGQGQKSLCDKHEMFGEYAHCPLLLQPQDMLVARKRLGQGVAAAATADGIPGCLALLRDNSEGRS